MEKYFNLGKWSFLAPFADAVLLIVIGLIVDHLLTKWLDRILERMKVDGMLYKFVIRMDRIIIWVIVIISILGKFGINATSIITVLAACGAAVALALQNSLSNLASGILLIVSKPFLKGDYVISAGVEGTIDSIDMLHTTLISADNKKIIVPNSSLTSNNVINATGMATRRVDVPLGVSYDSNLDETRKLLLDYANSLPQVLKEPAAVCNVMEYADSNVILTLRAWCNSADYWDVYFKLNNELKGILDTAGVSIDYPQLNVHMDK